MNSIMNFACQLHLPYLPPAASQPFPRPHHPHPLTKDMPLDDNWQKGGIQSGDGEVSVVTHITNFVHDHSHR